ncbi:uncharacterized protein VNE69_12184 [Vairimorpha necatrix]|uniref:Uncharacterized protein n=1 Tax=Vairimorpha necatrix TaxID=6039 RepID=A0AAX4JGT0_9MICR
MKQLRKLSVRQVQKRTKQEHRREVYNIVRNNKKYIEDPNYEYFINELLKGLLEDVEYKTVNEVVKSLQKIKQKNKKM